MRTSSGVTMFNTNLHFTGSLSLDQIDPEQRTPNGGRPNEKHPHFISQGRSHLEKCLINSICFCRILPLAFISICHEQAASYVFSEKPELAS